MTARDAHHSLLIDALRQPLRMVDLDLTEWDLLLRQARHAGLTGRLGVLLQQAGALDNIAPQPAVHLKSALLHAQAQCGEVRRELTHIGHALAGLGAPVVLLKGAAYVAAGLPVATGRLFTDIDLLVPEAALDGAESRLRMHGWLSTHPDAHDQRYYREWMHELPPMVHVRRGTVLDLHHAILPRTAALKPDPALLLAGIQPVRSQALFHTLSPVDLVLHSLTHLLHNEDMSRGLRDLCDIDQLLRQFSTQPDFWGTLHARAGQLDLTLPLHDALRAAEQILGTPMPVGGSFAATQALRAPWQDRVMGRAWSIGLGCLHPSVRPRMATWVLAGIFLRAHRLRMPWPLLCRHAANKTWRLLRTRAESKPT